MSIYCNNIINYKYMLLNEAYFGKTETLLEIEKQIGVIRSSIKKFTDINRSKEVLALNRLFEKQFGMEVFSLHIEQENTINAYTIPVAVNFDIAFNEILSRKVEASQKTGYRFKNGNNLCIICNIYMGLLCNKNFTDAEILAVILHELGHNFADALNKEIEVANKSNARAMIGIMIINCIISFGLAIPGEVAYYISNTNKYKKKVESKTKQRRIHGLFKGVKATCVDFAQYLDEISSRLLYGLLGTSYTNDPETQKKVKRSYSRQNEVIADKFAGIYGYGPEQASALLKMGKEPSRAKEFVDKIPGIGKQANDAFEAIFREIYKFDCHPNVIQRINEEIKTLKYELDKSDLDPKLIKAMKEQVKQLEKLKDEAMKVSKDLPESEQERAAFFAKVNEEDPDALDQDLEDYINRAFDSFLEDK